MFTAAICKVAQTGNGQMVYQRENGWTNYSIFDEILFSNKKEETTDTRNMDEFQTFCWVK